MPLGGIQDLNCSSKKISSIENRQDSQKTFSEEDTQMTRRLKKKNYDKNQELRECSWKLQGVTVSHLPEGEDLENPLPFN